MRRVLSLRAIAITVAGVVLLLAVAVGVVLPSWRGGRDRPNATTAKDSTTEASASPQRTHVRWVMRDLGTLGGHGSQANGINSRGQIVGFSYTKAKDAMGDQVYHAFLRQNGRMRDLGTLGGDDSVAEAINDRGQVVGWADTKEEDEDGEQIAHAFLWASGKMRDLGTLGGPNSLANDINSRGQIVGRAETKNLDRYAYPGTHSAHAFLRQNGRMLDLGTFGGPNSVASAISERGQIVGSAETRATIKEYGYTWAVEHAFSWQGGRMRDLDGIQGRRSAASDVNERGQIVGDLDTGRKDAGSKYGDEPIWHAFLWQNGKMRDLTARGPNSTASAINSRGQIAGAWWELGNSGSDPWDQAALWQGGKMVLLGTPSTSHANDVNRRGEIVGWSWIRAAGWDQHAVLWTLKP